MQEILTSLGDDLEPLRGELVRGEHVRASLALANQRAIAIATRNIERCAIEGLGELRMQVDPDLYFSMQILHGDDCWKDKGFRDSVYKNNPEVRTNLVPRKTTILRP